MLRRGSFWCLVVVLALVTAMLPGAAPVYAVDFIVNTTNDLADLNPADGVCDGSGAAGQQCSLRAAVQTANALGGAHTIVLQGTTYNLTNGTSGEVEDAAASGDLDVLATITIIGRGQEATRIDGQDKDRVFHVHLDGKLTLLQLTVRNGQTPSAPVALNRGGGIFNDLLNFGTATFVGAHINNNIPNDCVGTPSCPP